MGSQLGQAVGLTALAFAAVLGCGPGLPSSAPDARQTDGGERGDQRDAPPSCLGCVDADDTPSDVTAVDATSADSAPDAPDAAPLYDGPPCAPGADGCYRGVLATCGADGRWRARRACPAGQVCDGGGCVPNIARIVIALDNYGGGEVFDELMGATDAELLSIALAEARALNPGCASDYVSLGWDDEHGLPQACPAEGSAWPLRPIEVGKWWVRQLLDRFASDERLHVGLVHQAQFEGREERAEPSDCEDRGPACCHLGECRSLGYRLDDPRDPETLFGHLPGLADLLAIEDPAARGEYRRVQEVPDPGDGPESILFRYARHYVSAHPSRDLAAVGRWVDQTESLVPTGEACTGDADCGDGFCEAGGCLTHDNPEVVARLSVYQADLGTSVSYVDFFAYLLGSYVRYVLHPEGRPCSEDSECLLASYRCAGDGRCHDDAWPCRRTHVIWVGQFFVPERTLGRPGWASYLRYGGYCRGDGDCLHGASCWFEDPATHFECKKSYGQCRSPAGLTLPLVTQSAARGAATSFCQPLPAGPYYRDRTGLVVSAFTHTILTTEPPGSVYGPRVDFAMNARDAATATAAAGGGHCVAPCPVDDRTYFLDGPRFAGCDWRAQFEALVAAIRTDLDTFVCNPGGIAPEAR